MKGRFFTISNMLSISRAVLALPAAWMIWQEYPMSQVLLLALVAYISDLLDGYLARRLNQVSEWGKILDPIADKLFVGLVAIALIHTNRLELWYIAAVLCRDIVIILAGIYASRRIQFVLPSDYWGKTTVVTIGITLAAAFTGMANPYLQICYFCSSAMMLASLIHYGRRMLNALAQSQAEA
jgi:CDP-diacylglycerol--glycerol-3-phosphate 3-phosphatidyltransferase